ncbi:MAG: DUF1924 domain-containing protein [Rhodocyclaceae bacterium]|nr:MAG: DUF1924 domain-containing protein [Rhodocyclaceae bacterium]
MLRIAIVLFLACSAFAARADAIATLLKDYESQGASRFSAQDAETFWVKANLDPKTGETRRCTTCHTEDLRRTGKHSTTGKAIEPLAPSVNPKRLTDVEHIEKWFGRNCKWTLNRECTPQEKGNLLVMLRTK